MFSAHDPVVMHEISVPSPNVGLIIGKSGETIRRLESETFVKVQVTPGKSIKKTKKNYCNHNKK